MRNTVSKRTSREAMLAKMLLLIQKNPGIRPRELHRILHLEHSARLRNSLIMQWLVRKEKKGAAAVHYYPVKKLVNRRFYAKITPFLWFDKNAEEAMNFYVSVFSGFGHDAKIIAIQRYPGGYSEGPMKGMEAGATETWDRLTELVEKNDIISQ